MINDLFVFGGLASIAVGAWNIHPAMFWITLGVEAILVGVGGVKRKALEKNKDDVRK